VSWNTEQVVLIHRPGGSQLSLEEAYICQGPSYHHVLRMETGGSLETLVTFYQTARRHRWENLKSCKTKDMTGPEGHFAAVICHRTGDCSITRTMKVIQCLRTLLVFLYCEDLSSPHVSTRLPSEQTVLAVRSTAQTSLLTIFT
jgi:hypothetical protein